MRIELRGLADFARPVAPGVFAPFLLEGFGQHVLWPHRLEAARRDDGRPDWSLTLYRGTDPTRPPAPYGLLAARVACRYPVDEALEQLRARVPAGRATLRRAQPTGGFLRMTPVTPGELPEALLEPVRLVGDGLDHVWCRIRMSIDAGIQIRDALARGTLLVRTRVELEMPGVSPRAAAQAKLDPRALLTALHAQADANGIIERERLLAHVLAELGTLVPVRGTPEPAHEQIAEALVDRLQSRFATRVMTDSDGTPLRLVPAGEVDPGQFTWNLAEPHLSSRSVVLDLNPFDAARQLVAEHGIDSVVSTVTVPPFATGELVVAVDLNLPPRPEGLLDVGVNFDAPPAPPRRPQAATAAIELGEQRSGSAVLRLAAGEPPDYFYSVFAIVRGSGGIDRLVGPRVAHRGDRLYLTPADVPVAFVPVAADDALLAQGDLELTVRWTVADAPFEHRATMTREAPAVTLVLPSEHANASLDVAVIARDGSARRELPRLPATASHLGLHSFAEYGPQQVRIEARFGSDKRPLLIELVPDHGATTPEVVRLTVEEPSKPYSYHASSVLQPGFRWRRRPLVGDEPFSPWTTVSSPLVPLIINVDEEVAVETDEVVCERDPRAAERFSWWPRRPRPELANGKPTLMLLAGSDAAVLQLGTRWAATDEELEELRARLKQSLEGQFELVPATITSAEAALILDGKQLATSSTSGVAPYTALFNVRLDRAQLEATRRALGGKRDLLIARYHVRMSRSTNVTIAIVGDAAADVAALMGSATPEAAAARVDEAIADGRLRVVGDATPALIAQAKQACSKLLQSIATGADVAANPADVRVEVSAQEPVETALELTTDIASWFANGAARPNVIELPSGTNP